MIPSNGLEGASWPGPAVRRPRPLVIAPEEPAILCDRIGKRFYHYDHRPRSLRELFVRVLGGVPTSPRRAEFTLSDFSVRIEKGESVALVGANGSGKSTALRLMAGIYHPTTGSLSTSGRVAAVIELGVGFHPELTGRENVFQYGAALGMSARETARRMDEIEAFAELGDFIHEPTRLYSTGMRARLAFAVAITCSRPTVLLMDEILAVGDREFQARCLAWLHHFRSEGGTLVVVSHENDLVRQLCTRAVWMDHGRIRLDGPVGLVLDAYAAGSPEQPERSIA